ncbi:MAG: AAA family ATPase [Coxiellaceae bacterium]|nr:AAA family ATPase [Coxiellaceae bacterium]
MKRLIIQELVNWKRRDGRKPLILKGARQVGKTFALQAFAEQCYPRHFYFNFEKEPGLASVFESSLDPQAIVQTLGLYRQVQIDPSKDLIIFDEIQACPKALTSLKYFCEDMPQLHICAAGSLLGVYLSPVSYPVGKVDHMEMFPMSFVEFLMALGEDQYVDLLMGISLGSAIPDIAHQHLWQRLKHYFITGGLPEVVALFCQHQDTLVEGFNLVRSKQHDLIEDYFSDIAKHSGKINAMHINRLWRSIPEQLAQTQNGSATKYKFKGSIPGVDRYAKLVDALDWLQSAGLIIKVGIINKAALPLKAYSKDSVFKLFLFDVGLLGALSDIHPNTILDYDYGSHKGFFAENYVSQAFTYAGASSLYGWTEGTSEVEFVRDIEGDIIPIEVKSGWVTQAKSLKQFVGKYQPKYRVVISAKNLRIDSENKLQCLPLYLAEKFPLTAVDVVD